MESIKLFKWDRSHLGDITSYLKSELREIPKNKYGHNDIKVMDEGEIKYFPILIFNYKNIDTVLMIDRLKVCLDVISTMYHQADINGKTYLISFDYNTLPLDSFKDINFKPALLSMIRKCLAFEWVISLKNDLTERVILRSPCTSGFFPVPFFANMQIPFLFGEVKFGIDDYIPPEKAMIKKWFGGNYELFYKTIKEMMEDKTPEEIRTEVRELLLKYNPSIVHLTNTIFNNLLVAENNLYRSKN
jgi:hypothetical protein